MKIGIISDTHNLLREEVIGYLNSCDLIIHAGDICNKEVLLKLNNINKTVVVKCNNDNKIFEDILSKEELLEIEGKKLYCA